MVYCLVRIPQIKASFKFRPKIQRLDPNEGHNKTRNDLFLFDSKKNETWSVFLPESNPQPPQRKRNERNRGNGATTGSLSGDKTCRPETRQEQGKPGLNPKNKFNSCRSSQDRNRFSRKNKKVVDLGKVETEK